MSPSGTYETTGIIPSKQRVERKERSRLKKVLFSGKKDGQPGDGEYLGRQLLMFHKWLNDETITNKAHIYAISLGLSRYHNSDGWSLAVHDSIVLTQCSTSFCQI